MLRICPLEPFAGRYFGGAAPIEMAAGHLFAVVDMLDLRAPGFAAEAEKNVAFAVDGEVWTDWTAPLPSDAEITIFTRIAGG